MIPPRPVGLTFRPRRLVTVTVMRGEKPVGTIRRYRAHRFCLVRVEGVLTAAANPGRAAYPTIKDAKAALLHADANRP